MAHSDIIPASASIYQRPVVEEKLENCFDLLHKNDEQRDKEARCLSGGLNHQSEKMSDFGALLDCFILISSSAEGPLTRMLKVNLVPSSNSSR